MRILNRSLQPKLSASTTEMKEAKKARREETARRKAVQEEMGLIAMRVFEKLLARESDEGTIDDSSQIVGLMRRI